MDPDASADSESDVHCTAALDINDKPSWTDRFDLRGELDALADRIRRNSMLELLEYELGAPMSAAALDEVERRFGAPLPQEIRWLYGLFSTVRLSWRFRPDLDAQTRGRIVEEFADCTDRYNLYHQAGSIEFVPLDDMLFHEDYGQPDISIDGEIDFGGKVYPEEEFAAMVRVFDRVSEFFAMGFVVRPGQAAWQLAWLGDYWIDYQFSRMIYLEDYLKFIFAIWGREGTRDQLFCGFCKADLPEPMRFDPAAVAAVMPAILTSP